MKKKYVPTTKDKKDWKIFTQQRGNISPKEIDLLEKNKEINKIQKLDLHGFSLSESNKIVEKFINKSFAQGYKKLLIVTGKGLRSKSYDNPYISEKLSVLRYSVPEFIKTKPNLMKMIKDINYNDVEDPSIGSFDIFLKKIRG